jgi:lysophospholipase L1-like esterase
MKIFVFGDSITEGYFDTDYGGWCNRLIQYAMKKELETDFSYNRQIFNLGVAGNTSADILARMRLEIESRIQKQANEEKVFMIAVGVNDSQYDIETKETKVHIKQFEKNVLEMIKIGKDHQAKIVLIGLLPVVERLVQPMPWLPTHAYSNDMIHTFDESLKVFGENNGCSYINLRNIFADDTESYFVDGIHPNAIGHELILQKVKEALVEKSII